MEIRPPHTLSLPKLPGQGSHRGSGPSVPATKDSPLPSRVPAPPPVTPRAHRAAVSGTQASWQR